MIRYLQLPFQYDAPRMQQEVSALADGWRLHFNQHDYEGSWSGLSLRAPGGDPANLLAESLGAGPAFADTPLMAQCPHIAGVLQSLPCDKGAVRLLKLDRGAIVKPHRDLGLNFEEGEVRLHIPVVTHEAVEFYLDDDRLHMHDGECWYINASMVHRLANPSPVDRIHLVVDCFVNGWMTELFGRDNLPVKRVQDTTEAHRQQRRMVIESLKQSGDPARMALAVRMEAEDAAVLAG